MGGSIFKCEKCDFTARVASYGELDVYQKDHEVLCDGKLESIWKGYDKMTNEEKEAKLKEHNPMFRYGVLKGEK